MRHCRNKAAALPPALSDEISSKLDLRSRGKAEDDEKRRSAGCASGRLLADAVNASRGACSSDRKLSAPPEPMKHCDLSC